MTISEQSIFQKVSEKISKSKKPIIVCGHFKLMVNSSGSKFHPGIYQDLRGLDNMGCWTIAALALDKYAGNTPVSTFEMGANLIKEHSRAQMLILVKDWISRKNIRQDSSNNPLIMDYYNENKLPKSFLNILEERSLTTESILLPPNHLTYESNSLFFSENALHSTFDENVEFQSCSLGKICAQDQIPEYDYLVSIGCDLIVNFLPTGCGEALFEAKLFSKERYPALEIENFYCNGDVSRELFWNKVEN